MQVFWEGQAQEGKERELPFNVGEQQGCLGLCPGMDNEPAESLWAKMGGQASTGHVVVCVCYRVSDQDVDEASSDN